MAPIPDCARIAHKLSTGLEVMYVTFAARFAVGTFGDLEAMAEQHGQAWLDNMQPRLSQSVFYEECTATDLGDSSAPIGTFNGGHTPGSGSLAGPAPMNVAMVVTLKTAKRGKSYTGRIYVPGLTSNNIASNGMQWSDSAVEAIQQGVEDYKEQVDPDVGDDGKLVVASPKLGTYEDVTIVQARKYLGTQRRRVNAYF